MSSNVPPRRQLRPPSRSFAEVTGVSYHESVLDFVVPDLHRDLPVGLCITLEFGKHHPNPRARAMYRTGCHYYRLVVDTAERAIAGDADAERRLSELVALPEVRETRFGYVREGHRGHGVGAGVLSARVRRYIKQSRALREALPHHPDALSMIPLLGMDRVSDSHATITKLHIIRFTEDMAVKWRFNAACMREVEIPNVWDPVSERHITVRATLPVDDHGAPILLVPRKMVSYAPPLGGAGYFAGLDGPKTDGPQRAGRSKEDALRDADQHPGRLSGYAEDRLQRAKPRRFIRRGLGE